MEIEQIAQIVMDNMPTHEGSRSRVEENIEGVRIVYNRPYSPKWGFGGWSADYVEANGVRIEPLASWVRLT